MSIEIAPDLVDRQLRYMLDQIRLDDLSRVDEIKAAASLASDFRGRGAPFSQLPVSDTPVALDALMVRAADLNLPTQQALGLAVVMGLNQVGTRVATIMARNHGTCMAAIDRHVDLLARDFGRVGAAGLGSGGQETRVDELQAAGQTWVACPRLFAMAHGNSLERVLRTLAKVEARDLTDKLPRSEVWGAQLRQAAPDMGHFLAGAIVHLDPHATACPGHGLCAGPGGFVGCRRPRGGRTTSVGVGQGVPAVPRRPHGSVHRSHAASRRSADPAIGTGWSGCGDEKS